jgi:hypothetical protein
MSLPEVRQCADETHPLLGATALRVGENRWGIMSVANGGHFGDDTEVAEWTVLQAVPPLADEPEPEPEPESAPVVKRPPPRNSKRGKTND